MITKKEIIWIILAVIILGFSISFLRETEFLLYSILAIFLVLVTNITAKKITASYLDSEIEIKLWHIKRYGFKPKKHFKKPFPIGAFLPIILSVLSLGYVKWLASLVFDVKPKIYRAAKRHGLYSFSEMTEYHIGLIAAAGIFANLFFAVIGYLFGFPYFARLNIYFAFFNMIPISDLDGNKIFFGNLIIWSFLAIITLIGVAYCILLI